MSSPLLTSSSLVSLALLLPSVVISAVVVMMVS